MTHHCHELTAALTLRAVTADAQNPPRSIFMDAKAIKVQLWETITNALKEKGWEITELDLRVTRAWDEERTADGHPESEVTNEP